MDCCQLKITLSNLPCSNKLRSQIVIYRPGNGWLIVSFTFYNFVCNIPFILVKSWFVLSILSPPIQEAPCHKRKWKSKRHKTSSLKVLLVRCWLFWDHRGVNRVASFSVLSVVGVSFKHCRVVSSFQFTWSLLFVFRFIFGCNWEADLRIIFHYVPHRFCYWSFYLIYFPFPFSVHIRWITLTHANRTLHRWRR